MTPGPARCPTAVGPLLRTPGHEAEQSGATGNGAERGGTDES